jgi:hypothetical protein
MRADAAGSDSDTASFKVLSLTTGGTAGAVTTALAT